MSQAFNALTGVVAVGVACPPELREQGLDAFYVRPNDEAWAGALCRVLYHESVHFWQLFSSGFIANVIASEWARLESFEREGTLAPRDPLALEYVARGEQPFSAFELMECWARYWDVHTRNPARIVEEELPLDEIVPAGEQDSAYTHRAFDRFMQTGPDAALYAAPYRFMLDRANGDTHFVACVFPMLVHAAFGGPRPVAFLLQAFESACALHAQGRLLRRTGSINFDWLNNWTSVMGQVVVPTLRALGLPSFTSGLDVIERGRLGGHPAYAAYRARMRELGGFVRRLPLALAPVHAQATGPRKAELFALGDAPTHDPWIVFALPGQPEYRSLLGQALPPPRVELTDARIDAALGGAEAELETLVTRVARFGRAQYAASLGLPLDAFEG